MAVEESIKINIQANAEEFKIVSDIINRELGKLGKNFQVLEGDINQASQSMKRFESSSKGFNKGLMSISLILQDLPYGFRGIQNNLPALAQGFGVLYLAVSAVTAAMTYFVLEGDKMSKGTKELFETFKDFVNGVVNDLVNALYPAFKSIVESIRTLWSMFGDNIISVFKDTWDFVLKILKLAGDQIAAGLAAFTALLKGDWKSLGEIMVNQWKRLWNGIIETLAFSLKTVGNLTGALVKIFNKDLGETIKNSTASTADYFANQYKFAFKEVEKAGKKIDVFSLFGGKKGKTSTGKLEDPTIAVLEAKKQYYKDDILTFAAYEQEILKRQEDLEIRQAEIDKKGKDYIQAIREKYQQLQINSAKSASDKYLAQLEKINKDEVKEFEDQQKEIERIARMTMDMRFDIANAISKINEDFAKEDVKNLNTELSTALKVTKGSYKAQESAIKNAISKNQEFIDSAKEAGYETKVYEDNAKNLQSRLEGLGDSFDSTARQISGIVSGVLGDALASFGENIGKAFSGEKVDLFSGFFALLADGLSTIGKALIAYGVAMDAFKKAFSNPYAAIAAGVGLVAIGAFLKSKVSQMSEPKAFANGGIVSGPTMGLIGEYPGAASNPEVVAPLDKLKDMIGGGGSGQFVLRGQDLVLAMNRSEKSLNLRRG